MGNIWLIHPRRVRKSLRVPLQHLEPAPARQKQANVGCFNQIVPSLLLPNIDKNKTKKLSVSALQLAKFGDSAAKGAQVLQTGSKAGLLSDVPLSRQHSGVLLSSHSANSRHSHSQGGTKKRETMQKFQNIPACAKCCIPILFQVSPHMPLRC